MSTETQETEQDYYVGVLPRPPVASNDLIDILVEKFRAFRLRALEEYDGRALGRSQWSYESTRTIESYRKDLTSPTDFWIACFIAPAGLAGNTFRNVTKNPSAGHDPDATVNSDDERIVKEGLWIGLSSGHGPYSTDEWNLKQIQGGTYSDDIESRFHLANLYFLENYRGARSGDNDRMFKRIIYTSFDYCERYAYSRAKRLPAYCRVRGTITPAAIGTKLMGIYDSFGYHMIGWVPQVTAMLVNGAKVGSWPSVDENPGFYSDCLFPTFEKLSRIDKDGVFILKPGGSDDGQIWARM